MSREEAFDAARRLVQEGVDVANRAGIDPSTIVAPHCAETVAAEDNNDAAAAQNLMWHNVPVIIDDDTVDLFEMPKVDDDAGQQPSFRVTQTTANLALADFERYKSSLERMIEDWREEKARVMAEKKAASDEQSGEGK